MSRNDDRRAFNQLLATRRAENAARADANHVPPLPRRRRTDGDTGLIGRWFTPRVCNVLAYAAFWTMTLGGLLVIFPHLREAVIEWLAGVL